MSFLKYKEATFLKWNLLSHEGDNNPHLPWCKVHISWAWGAVALQKLFESICRGPHRNSVEECFTCVQRCHKIVIVLLLGILEIACTARFNFQQIRWGTIGWRFAWETFRGAVESQVLVFFNEVVVSSWGCWKIPQIIIKWFTLACNKGEAQDVSNPVNTIHLGYRTTPGPHITGYPGPCCAGPDHFLKEQLHQLRLEDEQNHLGFWGTDPLRNLLDALLIVLMIEVMWHHLLVGQAHIICTSIPEEAVKSCLAVIIVSIHNTDPVPVIATHKFGQCFGLMNITGNGTNKTRVAELVTQLWWRWCAAQLVKYNKTRLDQKT